MAVAALMAAGWLRHPAIPYLVGGWAATGIAASLAVGLVGRPVGLRPGVDRMAGRWRLVATGVAVLLFGHATWVQYTLWQVEHRWPAFETRTVAAATREIREATERTAERLQEVAALALDVPAEPEDAFAALGRLTDGVGERGVIVYTGGEPRAWAGVVRVSTDTLTDTLDVVQTPFYTVLYATASRGPQRAVATALLAAAPPADSIALALDRVVAERSGARSFGFLVAREASAGAGLALSDGRQLLARPLRLEPTAVQLRTEEAGRSRGLMLLAGMLASIIGALWAARVGLAPRVLTVGVALAVVAIVPLSALSNTSLLFDPTNFYVALGGPFTANVGAVALTSALLLLIVLALLRARAVGAPRWLALLTALAVATLGPIVLRMLARGISPPADGVPPQLWLAWQLALFLFGTTLLVLGGAIGRSALGERGLSPQLAPALAALSALAAPVLWTAPGRWPAWYPLLWVATVLCLVLARSKRRLPLNAAIVAGLGAMVLVWGATAQRRVQLAERDVVGLSRVDGVTSMLLDRFAMELQQGPSPTSRVDLLQRYAASDLVAAGHPIHLATWSPAGDQVAELALGADDTPPAGARALVREAQRLGTPLVQTMAANVGTRLVLAVPTRGGGATTATVAPRSRLFADDPYAALLGGQPESRAEPPYALALAEVGPLLMVDEQPRWRRKGDDLHADWITRLPTGAVLAHAEVELRPLDALIQRGTLVLLLDLAVLGLLWSLSALADGGFQRWLRLRVRRWGRSYRAQLTLALFVFFVVPAAVFTVWSSRRLTADDAESRGLLVRETLRAAGAPSSAGALRQAAARVDAPLLLYLNGRLQEASDPLYAALAPLGWFLPPSVAQTLGEGELGTSSPTPVGHQQVLVGYRVLPWEDAQTVLAAPARTSELALDRRRRDFAVLVAFAAVMGALAAFALSGVAARQLARPIGALRRAALSIARGEREPVLAAEPPREFQPVFTAFRRMAADLDASRTELEQARARTAAVLRHVASGVVAVDADGTVVLTNPAAERLLGAPLADGAPLPAEITSHLYDVVEAYVRGARVEEEFDLELGGRQLHARLTPLQHGAGGAVLTLDDVTEVGRAQRVLAWGEMARQVAHEIKNPLTPIRLGVQHLRRAYAAGRGDFAQILDQNVSRILAEIDRLDEIARAFSRYGTAPEERAPGELTDVAAVARDVVELERLGESAVQWSLAAPDGPVLALARGDELREVLLNLLENARLAHARCVQVAIARIGETVRIVVQDDGDGIPSDVLPRIFEPHFSTRTSGSGLGLAISRRLVEGWGGTMTVTSATGQKTEAAVTLAAGAR